LVPKNLDAESVQSHGRTGGSKVNLVYVLRCISQEQSFNAKQLGRSCEEGEKKTEEQRGSFFVTHALTEG